MEKESIKPDLRVLVVEDEILIGLLLEDMIGELGATFVGPFATLASALAAVRQEEFDIALIDMNLGAERADDVATLLAQRGKPFALVSGSTGDALNFGQGAVLEKPFSFDDLAAVVNQLGRLCGDS